MPPAAQARARDMTKTMLAEMPLNELRQARGLTQAMLASLLHVEQPSIAKMEKRTDMYLSTLRHLVQAMGGDLVVTAKFPDGEVKINNFSDLDPIPKEQHPKPVRVPKQSSMRPGAAT